jgi:diadenosine tetraphosphate (Ap4A) HIT family hydrolase
MLNDSKFQIAFNYLRYSGASVSITINPFHWNIIPRYFASNEWPNEKTKAVSWLFLTIRFWLDDGSW